MKIRAYESFRKKYKSLPLHIQVKVDKQISILSKDFHHPSLHTKKIKGTKNIWETRVDLQYRMTFEIIEDTIYFRVVGVHDEVLSNP